LQYLVELRIQLRSRPSLPDYQEALYDISDSGFLMTKRFYAILAGRQEFLEAARKPADSGDAEAGSAWDD